MFCAISIIAACQGAFALAREELQRNNQSLAVASILSFAFFCMAFFITMFEKARRQNMATQKAPPVPRHLLS